MNILIVGCSEAGCYLARKLEDYHQDVSVLDNDQKNLDRLHDYGHSPFKGVAISGVPIDVDVLRSAGIEECDAVLAMTEDDNVNVMVAQVAQEIFKIKKVLACIKDPVLKEIFSAQLNVVTLSPTILMANMLTNIILEEMHPYVVPFGKQAVVFKPVAVASKFEDLTISQLPASKDGVLLGILHPDGNFDMANEGNAKVLKDDIAIVASLN